MFTTLYLSLSLSSFVIACTHIPLSLSMCSLFLSCSQPFVHFALYVYTHVASEHYMRARVCLSSSSSCCVGAAEDADVKDGNRGVTMGKGQGYNRWGDGLDMMDYDRLSDRTIQI